MVLRYPKVVGFVITEEIGGGGYAKVFRATHFEDRRVAACKVVPFTDSTTDADRKMLEREVRIHSALSHANVIAFISAVVVETKRAASTYVPGVYMLLELAAGGDLFDKIAPDVGVSDDIAHFYFSQLAAGIDYIHSQGVVHRDLKPENLLLDAAGTLKLSDFGLGSVWKLVESGKVRKLTDVCGSLPYIAPELNLGKPYHAPPIDIWGMGVILFTLLVGNTPWDEPTERSPEYAAFLTREIMHEVPWNRIGGNELSLLLGMLTPNPDRRMEMPAILAHPWVCRPSQVLRRGPAALAEELSAGLRASGDLDVAEPQADIGAPTDEDVRMGTAPMLSQFTQSLVLFSQTQPGGPRKHSPHLTRFYARPTPIALGELVERALRGLGVKVRVGPPVAPPPPADEDGMVVDGEDSGAPEPVERVRMRVGGLDARREQFKGWVDIEPFRRGEWAGSFVVMRRETGNPISWRQLWKALIQHADVAPHVYRKQQA